MGVGERLCGDVDHRHAGILGLWGQLAELWPTRTSRSHYLMGPGRGRSDGRTDPVSSRTKSRKPEQLNDADYLRAVEPLRRLRHAVPDIHYVYTLVLAPAGGSLADSPLGTPSLAPPWGFPRWPLGHARSRSVSGGVVHFVLDAADPNAKRAGGGSDQSGVWEVYEQRTPAMMLALGDGQGSGAFVSATTEPVTDDWGTVHDGLRAAFGTRAVTRSRGRCRCGCERVSRAAEGFAANGRAPRSRSPRAF